MKLLLYFGVYFALAIVGRSLLVWRRSGHNPLVLPARDDAHGYVGRAFKAVMLALAATCVLHAAAPGLLARLGAIALLQDPVLHTLGWIVLAVSLLWTLLAQAAMGSSWRIGIDDGVATELVQHGPFGVSRNPIFLGVRLSLLGLFFVLPHAFTLVLLVAGEVLMQVQVRLEEAHLWRLHGDPYKDYCAQVRRWL